MRHWNIGAALLALATTGVSAQAPQDSRWLAWVGCWQGAQETEALADESYLVCFRPMGTAAAPGDGVQIVTYSGGSMVSTEILRADGSRSAVEESGCAGSRVAAWSSDGGALLLSSSMNCGSGLVRATRGALAHLDAESGWVEIHAVGSDGAEPVLGIRSFLPATPDLLAEAGVTDPAAGFELAVATARSRATRPLSSDAIVELVREAGPEVTSALIVARGDAFDLDAGTLRSLVDRGVPGSVIDVMVAVTYPDRFQLAGPDATTPELIEPATPRESERATAPWPDRGVRQRGYSPWGYGYYDPYWSYSYRYYDYYGYYPYGGDFYGSFGRPYYGYPRVIVVAPPTVRERGARLDPTRGLVPPESGTTRPAAPRTNTRPSDSSSGSSSSTQSRPRPDGGSTDSGSSDSGSSDSGSSGSGPSRPGSSSGGSDSPEPVRRAVPRPN